MRRKITRRSKKPSSSGSLTRVMMLSLRTISRKSLRSPKPCTFLTSLHLRTVSDLAFKSLMICQKISRHCLTRACTLLTPIWFLRVLPCTVQWVLSTSPSRLSLPSSRRRCPSFRLLFFYPASKISHPRHSTYSTSTNNLHPRSKSKPILSAYINLALCAF